MVLILRVDHLYPLFLAFCIGSREVGAQSSTALFAGDYPVIAYAIGSTANVVTTYLVACPAGSETSTCNFQQPYILRQGPSTVQLAMAFPGSTTIDLRCTLSGSSSMACAATESNPGSTKSATTIVTGDVAAARFRAISIVTNSADLLTYAAGMTTASDSSATSSSSAGVSKTSLATSIAITSTPISSDASRETAVGTIKPSTRSLLAGTASPSPTLLSVSWSSSTPTITSVASESSTGGALGAGVKNGANHGLLGVMGIIGVGVLGF
ncbi:hypothetical protein SBOR_6466 [Sclerotinia borealis F-4128]|uniref:GPI anchored protein n=1 Tax=Sclerotinia borealis (strain F-4128) TaxID=1432307 RepID=W9CEA9_SCLBF|nr:hypothetical protein SBOR_6466 [Sclerotinia borealis F-4128]